MVGKDSSWVDSQNWLKVQRVSSFYGSQAKMIEQEKLLRIPYEKPYLPYPIPTSTPTLSYPYPTPAPCSTLPYSYPYLPQHYPTLLYPTLPPYSTILYSTLPYPTPYPILPCPTHTPTPSHTSIPTYVIIVGSWRPFLHLKASFFGAMDSW